VDFRGLAGLGEKFQSGRPEQSAAPR
jgi:hypothetical protein